MKPLNAAERKTLRMMTYLAVQWETTLIQSNTPDHGKPDAWMRQSIRQCERNIKRFRALEARLSAPSLSVGAAQKNEIKKI